MSNRTSDFLVSNTLVNTDRFVILSDPEGSPSTETVSFETLKKNLANNTTPTANSGVFVGQLWLDSNFLYVNTTGNIIKKIPLLAL